VPEHAKERVGHHSGRWTSKSKPGKLILPIIPCMPTVTTAKLSKPPRTPKPKASIVPKNKTQMTWILTVTSSETARPRCVDLRQGLTLQETRGLEALSEKSTVWSLQELAMLHRTIKAHGFVDYKAIAAEFDALLPNSKSKKQIQYYMHNWDRRFVTPLYEYLTTYVEGSTPIRKRQALLSTGAQRPKPPVGTGEEPSSMSIGHPSIATQPDRSPPRASRTMASTVALQLVSKSAMKARTDPKAAMALQGQRSSGIAAKAIVAAVRSKKRPHASMATNLNKSVNMFRPWRVAAISVDGKPIATGPRKPPIAREPPKLPITAATSQEGPIWITRRRPSAPSWPVPAPSNSSRKRNSKVYLLKVGDSGASKCYTGQLQARKALGCSTTKLTEISRTDDKRGVIKGYHVSFWRPQGAAIPILDPDGFAYEDAQPDHDLVSQFTDPAAAAAGLLESDVAL